MIKRKITVTITDNHTKRQTSYTMLERDGLEAMYNQFDGVMDAISHDVLARMKPAIMKAAEREMGKRARNTNGEVVWRLEFHDEEGMHWNANDEDKPNTNGYRTVITCTHQEFDAMDLKAEETYNRLLAKNGRVEYLDFYKAMNA